MVQLIEPLERGNPAQPWEPWDMTKHEVKAVEAYEAYLYAIHTGELYPIHCQLAKASKDLEAWKDHIRYLVLPMYRREVEHADMSDVTMTDLALELKEYYEEHVAETV